MNKAVHKSALIASRSMEADHEMGPSKSRAYEYQAEENRKEIFSLLLLLLAAGLQGACADPKKSDFTTSSASVPVIAQDAIASDRSEPKKTSISSQELEARLLSFVDGFKSPADMNYMRLEAALGTKFGDTSNSLHPFYIMKNVYLSDGYTFYATHVPAEEIFSVWKSPSVYPNVSTQRVYPLHVVFGMQKRCHINWRNWVTSVVGKGLSREDGCASIGAHSTMKRKASPSHC